MFHGIEKELSNGEPWAFGKYSQLPPNIQLLLEQEDGQQDIWELTHQEADNDRINQLQFQKRSLAFKLPLS
ncbi:hypothetical protein H6G27_11190 [Nostoc linckia FACHB-104]|nr:hypothetical protein [Nostoc linckia FACHB-104]